MSTSSTSSTGLITPVEIESSTGLTSGSTLTNTGGTTQIVGIASGINTTELIQAELAEDEMPLENMEDQVSGLTTENNTLSTLQTALSTVSFDAEILAEPSTYFPTQTINSSDTSLITAATTDGPGAPIGSTTINVLSLASAAQTTLSWTPGSSSTSDTITLTSTAINEDGSSGATTTAGTVTVAANATAAQVASAINGDSSLGIYATTENVTNNGVTTTQLVLSSATTGSGFEVGATDSASQLSQVSAAQGEDAQFYLNGDSTDVQSSASDSVTDAIAGVTLSLLGVTGDTPVTITADSPGVNTTQINTYVQQLVTDYNTALSTLNTDVNTAPESESTPSDYSPYSGSLFGDDELEELMSDMRDTIEQSFSGTGISSSMDNLSQIGITTAGTSGSVSSSDEVGELSVDTTTLDAAIESNPSGVQALLTAFSSSLQTTLNNAAGVSGAIADRIQGNDSIITNLNSQLSSQEALYDQEEKNMEEEWATVESTLEDLDDQKTNFSSFADGLSSSDSSSSS